MMRSAILFLLAATLTCAANKDQGPLITQAGNDKLALTATLYLGKDAVKEQLGSDLDGYFILVKVDVAPKGGKPLSVSRDDFILRSYKDGQKSQPFAPTQIAGKSSMVVRTVPGSGGIAAEQGGPVWGTPGGGMGRLPGSNGSMGNGTADTSSAQATVQNDAGKDNPVLAVLKQKILPEKQTAEPLSGLLYFSLEGKHKPKDLVLQYVGPAGRLILAFDPKDRDANR